MERLQKIIARSGITSRRKAEDLILKGVVKVNGKIIKELGFKVNTTDIIEINGEIINNDEHKEYYLLNKPRGVISSVKDDKNRKCVVDYIDTNCRLFPVGRLDYDTTGLILLTNDGNLANILMHPKNNVLKTYVAKIEGFLTKDDIYLLKNGLTIEGRKTIINDFKIKDKNKENNTSLIEITISEGRNHIVKKIFKALNHPVIRLSRIRLGFLDITNLKSGQYRALSIKEVKKLYSLVK